MIEEVAPNLFRVTVPLPFPGVNSMNSYIITDPDRNLIIDPGMALRLCYDAMTASLAELKLDIGRTDYFLTHHHLDLSAWYRNSKLKDRQYISIKLKQIRSEGSPLGDTLADKVQLLRIMGFPEKDPMNVVPVMNIKLVHN